MSFTSSYREWNFDGLIGPTHHFAGLAVGNLASSSHKYQVSSPRQAALQGIAKMRQIHRLGVKQAFLPPLLRPSLQALRMRGYEGSDRQILDKAYRCSPEDLLWCASSSSMWTANAATVSPSIDTADQRVHISVANLATMPHRALEADETALLLQQVFRGHQHFHHHPPLPADGYFCDEGAANHLRLGSSHGGRGIEIFVYGVDSQNPNALLPKKYPARQSRSASLAVARQHQLDPKRTFFIQQNPQAIDAGVFHNDVIATANENVMLYHEDAFLETSSQMRIIQEHCRELFPNQPFFWLPISRERLSLAEAIVTYFFNSQIVGLPNGGMALIAPVECRENLRGRALLDDIIHGDNPICEIYEVDLRQSMANGGGPACLRLRVVCNRQEEAGIHPAFVLDDHKLNLLESWIRQHYRERLTILELADYAFYQETLAALDTLTQILQLGSIYPFQQNA
jgi:succinylarginine dihydrolase